MRCRRCHEPLVARARFCPWCGERSEADAPYPRALDGERRHLTVMFCDLVDSTALAGRLDPEDLRDLLEVYRATCSRAIRRYEGHVAQYLGDGIVVYFSYPLAHEDDPDRAVRAALTIIEELGLLNPRFERAYGVRVAVRVGIHTGPVLVGAMGGAQQPETLALGPAVNLAARLQALAEPGQVVISGSVLRLLGGLFETEGLGEHRIKGMDEPLTVHRVLRPAAARTRLEAAAEVGLTPLVGREQDLAALLECWDRTGDRQGRVVLVDGEPGIGKSRLVRALRERLAGENHGWLEVRCSPYHRNSAFHPVIELLRGTLGLSLSMPADAQVERIETAVDSAGLERDRAVPALAALLSLDLPDRYAPPELSAEARRRTVLETLCSWVVALALRQRTVLVAEDLQWADPSTLELLGRLVAAAPETALLQVFTFRPGFEPSWDAEADPDTLSIQPLTRRQTAEMVREIAGRRLPPELVEQMVRRTDGVPLFVEELTRSVLESGVAAGEAGDAPSIPGPVIPSTLQDSLMARLDRLGRAKDMAQVGAVLGRAFSHELVSAVSTAESPVLDELLGQLVQAGMVHREDAPPEVTYTFKHALIQEAAYRSLLRGTRRALHARVAQVLEEGYPARVAAAPEELARHAEEGGLLEKAVTYLWRAGTRATERSAHAEAIGHLTRAARLLGRLPPSPQRDSLELRVQVALGVPLVAARGWGSQDAVRAYERSRALCERIGETPQLFHVVRGLVTFYVARAELVTARGLCHRLLRIAEEADDDSMKLVAHQQLGIVLYYQGEPATALQHYERALGLYDPPRHRPLTSVYGEDLGVFIRIWMAWALWLRGHPDQASRRCEEALVLGREARHPFSHAYALLWAAVVHSMRREHRLGRERAGAAATIAEEQGFAFVRGGGRMIRAWGCMDPTWDADARSAAIEDFRRALVETAGTGSEVCGPQILGGLAEGLSDLGREEEALATVDAALATSARTTQPYWDADLLRMKGELVLRRSGPSDPEAERLLREALDVARRQQARSLELRAATSLARLWEQQGRRAASRDLLAPVHAAFTEGFGTRDLKDAAALLQKLG